MAMRYVVGAVFVLMVGCSKAPRTDVTDSKQVALGKRVYDASCAGCHGVNLEGQPNWRERKPDGKLPAPPHDAKGHTWEHSDKNLFEVTKFGFASKAGKSYSTDMPAFEGTLSDAEIWAVITYIKSRWPARIREKQSGIPDTR